MALSQIFEYALFLVSTYHTGKYVMNVKLKECLSKEVAHLGFLLQFRFDNISRHFHHVNMYFLNSYIVTALLSNAFNKLNEFSCSFVCTDFVMGD